MSDVRYLYVAEIPYWNGAGVSTLYVATHPFATGAADTPAHTIMEPRLLQPALMLRDAFDTQRTSGRSRVGIGDCVLANDEDGTLDFLLNPNTGGVDGRTLIVRRGKPGAAYPAGFTTVFKGPMAYATGDDTTVTIKMRDASQLLSVPFQTTKYLGNNALPAGLEGTAELTGKPKPVTLGQVKNITPVCVNTSKLIYQVSDGAIASVEAVYDRGVSLAAGYRWNATAVPGGGAALCAAYGNGLFIVAGNAGALRTSPDGTTWTSRATAFGAANIAAVAYGGGTWVGVGSGHTVNTSPDGITWTNRANTITGTINCVAYGDGVFVVGTSTGELWTSPDGITWTKRTSPFSTGFGVAGIAFGNGLFMAAGQSVTGPPHLIATSPDGVTWTTNATGVSAQPYSVGFGNRTFYVGYNSSGAGLVLASSDTGTSFIERATGVLVIVYAWAFGSGRMLAGGLLDSASAPTSIAVSVNDGETWHAAAANVPTYGLAYANGVFVAASNGVIYTSTAPAAYASQADLLDDSLAPAPGTFKYYASAAGSYVRLGSSPAGAPTCDVTQGAAAANRTAAQLFTQVLQRAGLTAANWNAGDITALDAANSAVQGVYVDAETTCDAVADTIASSVWAWWGADKTMAMRVQQFALPTGAPALSWVRDDTIGPLTPIESSDQGNGVPTYQSILQFARNYTVQTTDLAGSVDAATRAALAQEWQTVEALGAGVQAAHPLAVQTVEPSCFVSAADAQTEVNRRQTIRGTPRRWFKATVDWDDTNDALDLGLVVQQTHPRYGLAGGVSFRVLGLQPDASANTITVLLWG